MVQQKVQSAEIGHLESLDLTKANSPEVFFDSLGGNLLYQQRVIFRF
jgi:hypothetical protein